MWRQGLYLGTWPLTGETAALCCRQTLIYGLEGRLSWKPWQWHSPAWLPVPMDWLLVLPLKSLCEVETAGLLPLSPTWGLIFCWCCCENVVISATVLPTVTAIPCHLTLVHPLMREWSGLGHTSERTNGLPVPSLPYLFCDVIGYMPIAADWQFYWASAALLTCKNPQPAVLLEWIITYHCWLSNVSHTCIGF